MANKMKIKEMTKRVTHTLENYPINILGHPTDRLLNKREPLQINLDKVFKSAKDNDIFLEINAAPKRMDLSGENIKAALDIGSKFALSTDAHNKDHLPYYFLGVNMARRGWIEKKNLLNCWSLNKIEKHLSI
jgi:DNA polymerase (family X)